MFAIVRKIFLKCPLFYKKLSRNGRSFVKGE